MGRSWEEGETGKIVKLRIGDSASLGGEGERESGEQGDVRLASGGCEPY